MGNDNVWIEKLKSMNIVAFRLKLFSESDESYFSITFTELP